MHYYHPPWSRSTCSVLCGRSAWTVCRRRGDSSRRIRKYRSRDSIAEARTTASSQNYFATNSPLSTKCDPYNRWLFGWRMMVWMAIGKGHFHFYAMSKMVKKINLPIFRMNKVNECATQPHILRETKTFSQVCCGRQNHTIMHWNRTTKAFLLQLEKEFTSFQLLYYIGTGLGLIQANSKMVLVFYCV